MYIDSGFQAERDQSLNDGDHFTHYCTEAVVLFPVVEKAAASLTTSAQQWPTCREYTHAQSNSHWTVAQITNANDALSTTTIEQNAGAAGWGCRRAVVLKSNAIIGINACIADPGDSALKDRQPGCGQRRRTVVTRAR